MSPNAMLMPWISNSSAPVRIPQLLLVDDDRVMREMIGQSLRQQGYTLTLAGSGEEALALLTEHPGRFDTIILDREMPGMSGMQLVARLKEDAQFANIPIIMLTGTSESQKVEEGIDAGVYYYLVKPTESTVLRSVIDAALRERNQKTALMRELGRHGGALKAMRHCQIMLRTLSEAEDTAAFLASCFPDPERVVSGLLELLINAVEHGNLGITYEEKSVLLEQNQWRAEVDRRLALPENNTKYVDVVYQHKSEGHLVQITDCGHGFDWKRYWHINPARAGASHGRGIARARLMAFDRIGYNEAGNSVTVMAGSGNATGNYAW